MSMVARTSPAHRGRLVTDTDDGDTRISAGAFWQILCRVSCVTAIRLPGGRCDHLPPAAYLQGIVHITREAEAWQQEQQAAVHQTLVADVPGTVINGESVNLWLWRTCCLYRGTRPDSGAVTAMQTDNGQRGDRRADALDIQTSDLWRDVSWPSPDILCRPRIFAELLLMKGRHWKQATPWIRSVSGVLYGHDTRASPKRCWMPTPTLSAGISGRRAGSGMPEPEKRKRK